MKISYLPKIKVVTAQMKSIAEKVLFFSFWLQPSAPFLLFFIS